MKTIVGVNGSVELRGDHVVISKGRMSGNSTKTILLCDIVEVVYKKSGLTRAHIAIVTAGDKDERVNVVQQPNVILLKSGQGDEAVEFKSAVESAVRAAKAPASASSAADEIAKYKGLLDAGAITEAEFEAKKKQLLSI